MPTYDYECGECKHKFEHFQSMSSDPLKECPECKKDALQKMISGGLGVLMGEDFSAHHERIKQSYKKG
jgi:putative FmdB family regulatory protein